jgi:hypothetical protein
MAVQKIEVVIQKNKSNALSALNVSTREDAMAASRRAGDGHEKSAAPVSAPRVRWRSHAPASSVARTFRKSLAARAIRHHCALAPDLTAIYCISLQEQPPLRTSFHHQSEAQPPNGPLVITKPNLFVLAFYSTKSQGRS